MDDKTEAEIRRAERARVFMEDSIFQDAWGDMEAALELAWRQSPARDTEGRERAWAMLRAMDNLRAALEQYVHDGSVAQDRLNTILRDKAVNGQ